MAEMDERFQQILSWQQMDQNKAISQILQEVSPGGRGSGGGQEGHGEPGAEWQNSTWRRRPGLLDSVQEPRCLES